MDLFYVYMCVYIHTYIYTHKYVYVHAANTCSLCGDQEKSSDPLELELQAIVRCVAVLGTEPGSSESAFNCYAISPPFITVIVTIMVLGKRSDFCD